MRFKEIIILFSIFLSFNSYSQMVLERMHYELKDEISIFNIANSSEKESIFVKVEVYKINVNTGEENVLSDPTEFIISPSRITIPPKSNIPFRVFRKAGDVFSVYRVRFIPYTPTIKGIEDESELKAGVGLRIAFGTIFYSSPKDSVFESDVKYDETSRTLSVGNNGTGLITIDKLNYCNVKENKCVKNAKKYLIPGQEFKEVGVKDIKFKIVSGHDVENHSF